MSYQLIEPGVTWNKQVNKWQAQIVVNRKNIYLGCFDNLEEAAAVRREADKKYKFTERHGV